MLHEIFFILHRNMDELDMQLGSLLLLKWPITGFKCGGIRKVGPTSYTRTSNGSLCEALNSVIIVVHHTSSKAGNMGRKAKLHGIGDILIRILLYSTWRYHRLPDALGNCLEA